MGPNGSPTCGSEREVKCLFDHVKHSETCLCNRSPVLLYLDGDHHSHTLLPPKEKEKKKLYPASLEGQLSHADFYKRPFQSLADSAPRAAPTMRLRLPAVVLLEKLCSSIFTAAIVVLQLFSCSLFPNRVNLGSILSSSSFDDKKWILIHHPRLSMATSCYSFVGWEKRG